MAQSQGSDAFFEDRFDASKHTIKADQLDQHDQTRREAGEEVFVLQNLQFAAGLPAQVVELLNQIIPAVLNFSTRFGIKLRDANHPVRFLNRATYEQETGTKLPPKVVLPASRLDFNPISRVYTVTIILPDDIQNNEEVINIARTLFSKLMGEVYLLESILPLEFYKQSGHSTNEEITAGILERLDLIAALEFPSDTVRSYGEQMAKQLRMPWKKEQGQVRRQWAKQWQDKHEQQGLSSEELHVLDSAFTDFLQAFREQPGELCAQAVELVKQLNAQLHFLLPHDLPAYRHFEESEPFHYVQAASLRMEEVLALSGFVEGCWEQLENLPEDEDVLEGLQRQIRLRLRQLHEDRKALPFLIPDREVEDALQEEAGQLPLQLVKCLPPEMPKAKWKSECKKLERHYTNSIFLKVYEGLEGILLLLRTGETLPEEQQNATRARIEKLLQMLRFRKPMLDQVRAVLGLLQGCSEVIQQQRRQHRFPLDEFRKAWSYFISSLLIMEYYEQPHGGTGFFQQRFSTEKYLQSIQRFVGHQLDRGINYFHIVQLFLKIYLEKHNDNPVDYILYMIRNPQAALRYVLHQVMLPLEDNPDRGLPFRKDKLDQYRDTLIKVYDNRLDEAIRPEESEESA